MNYIVNNSTDPYFNMAFDEYCLEVFEGQEFFYIWRNAPSVILGCNQNVELEVDLDYCRDNNISIVRRCTGGGMVFHDLGNVNVSFIGNASNLYFIDKVKDNLISALSVLGIDAITTARNDLFIDGKKFSGTAVRLTAKNILFHGTLLFNADLQQIKQVSNKQTGKIIRKAVASQPSDVTNLLPYIDIKMSVRQFMQELQDTLATTDGELIQLTSEQISAINQLAECKYRKVEWIYQTNEKI